MLENGTVKKHKRIVHWRMWLWSYSSSEGSHWSPIKLNKGSQATGKFTYRREWHEQQNTPSVSPLPSFHLKKTVEGEIRMTVKGIKIRMNYKITSEKSLSPPV